jgi:hypothetical protein
MSDINVQLVREFFELHLFRVLTNWQQAPHLASEHAAQLFVENTQTAPPAAEGGFANMLVDLAELHTLERAVVEIRAWHGDRFYASIIESNPILHQFAQKDVLSTATACFGDLPFSTVLVVSELPASAEPRTRALQVLRRFGVDYVVEFPTVLRGILEKVSEGSSYTGSPTLQTIRLLKRYRFLRNLQLEFGFVNEVPVPAPLARVETIDTSADEQEEMFQ